MPLFVTIGGLVVLPAVVALLYWLYEMEQHPKTPVFPYIVKGIGTLTLAALLVPFPSKSIRGGRVVGPSSDTSPAAIEGGIASASGWERLGEAVGRLSPRRDEGAHAVLSLPWTPENVYRGKDGQPGLTLSNTDRGRTALPLPKEAFRALAGGTTALFFQDSRAGLASLDLSSVEALVISVVAADPGWMELHAFVDPAHGYSYRLGTFELRGGPQEISIPAEAIRRLINRGYKALPSAFKDRISGVGLNFGVGIGDPQPLSLQGPNRYPLRLRIGL